MRRGLSSSASIRGRNSATIRSRSTPGSSSSRAPCGSRAPMARSRLPRARSPTSSRTSATRWEATTERRFSCCSRPGPGPGISAAAASNVSTFEKKEAEAENLAAPELAVAGAAVLNPFAQIGDPFFALVLFRVALPVPSPGVLVGIPVVDAARDGALEVEPGFHGGLDRPLIVLQLLARRAECDEVLRARLLAPVALAEEQLAPARDIAGENGERRSNSASERDTARADDEVEGAGLRRVFAHVLFEQHDLRLGHASLGLPACLPEDGGGIVEPGGAHIGIALDDPKEDLRLPAPEIENVGAGFELERLDHLFDVLLREGIHEREALVGDRGEVVAVQLAGARAALPFRIDPVHDRVDQIAEGDEERDQRHRCEGLRRGRGVAARPEHDNQDQRREDRRPLDDPGDRGLRDLASAPARGRAWRALPICLGRSYRPFDRDLLAVLGLDHVLVLVALELLAATALLAAGHGPIMPWACRHG